MSEEIIKVLEHLSDKMGVAIDWTGNNVLPYLEELCQKFVRWEMGTSVAWIVITVLFMVSLFVLATVIYKKADKDIGGALYIIGAVLSLIAIGVVAYQVFDIIKCTTIPEMVIYDYAMRVIGGTS